MIKNDFQYYTKTIYYFYFNQSKKHKCLNKFQNIQKQFQEFILFFVYKDKKTYGIRYSYFYIPMIVH